MIKKRVIVFAAFVALGILAPFFGVYHHLSSVLEQNYYKEQKEYQRHIVSTVTEAVKDSVRHLLPDRIPQILKGITLDEQVVKITVHDLLSGMDFYEHYAPHRNKGNITELEGKIVYTENEGTHEIGSISVMLSDYNAFLGLQEQKRVLLMSIVVAAICSLLCSLIFFVFMRK